MTDKELQSLRNIGNEAEAAADEIVQLRADLAREHADHHQTVIDAAMVARENTTLRTALTELRDRLKAHPVYADLTEEEEEATGGDEAEFSYLVRVADAALGA